MMIQTIGYILELPEIDDEELRDLLGPQDPLIEPIMINPKNITLISPGDDGSTLIYLLDQLTVYCSEPYEVIADKIAELDKPKIFPN